MTISYSPKRPQPHEIKNMIGFYESEFEETEFERIVRDGTTETKVKVIYSDKSEGEV